MFMELINLIYGATAPTDEYNRRVEEANKKISGAGVQALKEFKEHIADQFGLSNDYSTSDLSTAMTEKARSKAKETTGTLTAQNSQSQAYNAQNAQQNAGINKSQAAMSGQNMAAGNYENTYNDTLESQTNAMSTQLQDQYDAAKDWYQTERASDIMMEGQQQLADTEQWWQSMSDTKGPIYNLLQAIQDKDYTTILKMLTGFDSIKDLITKQVPNTINNIKNDPLGAIKDVGLSALTGGVSTIGKAFGFW